MWVFLGMSLGCCCCVVVVVVVVVVIIAVLGVVCNLFSANIRSSFETSFAKICLDNDSYTGYFQPSVTSIEIRCCFEIDGLGIVSCYW